LPQLGHVTALHIEIDLHVSGSRVRAAAAPEGFGVEPGSDTLCPTSDVGST
jgi:hypothetical protein